MLIGNVGREPETHYYENDQCVVSFSLATTERGYTLPNGTVVPDRTDWHDIVLFKGLAKYAESYIHKGDKIYVEGRIRYHLNDDKRDETWMRTEICADKLEWLAAPRKLEDTATTENMPPEQQASGNSKLPF